MAARPWEFKSPPEHKTFLRKQSQPKIILYNSYIQAIRNSVGSNLFRNLYMLIGKKEVDVLENGNLSCAVFVSSILYFFKLLPDLHATVSSTVADLEKSGWISVKRLRPGTVLVWEAQKFGNENHEHIGFYMGANRAISNSSKKHRPAWHHYEFGTKNGQPVRKIKQIFWNKKLK